MMTLVAAVLLGQTQTPPAADLPKGGTLVSGVMSKYRAAKSLSATIDSQVKSGQTVISIRSRLQYDRPNRFFLSQNKSTSGPVAENPNAPLRSALIICDGVQVTYEDPDDAKRLRGQRLYEPAFSADGTPYDIDSICVIGRISLLEESIALDLLTGEMARLQLIAEKLVTCVTVKAITRDEKTAYVVEGKLNDYPVRGTYQMIIDEDYNLLEMSTHANVEGSFYQGPYVKGSFLITQKVNAVVDGPTDASLYKIAKGR